MKMLRIWYLSIFSLMLSPLAWSQVGGGVSIGMNASQIDGDLYGGYSKIGYNVGGYSFFEFTENIAAQVEILFSEKGSRAVTDAFTFRVALHYIQVPLLFRYTIFGNDRTALSVHVGPSIDYLWRAQRGTGSQKIDDLDNYSTLGVDAHAGATFRFTPNIALTLRHSLGLTNANNLPGRNPWFRHRYLTTALRINWNN